MRAVRCRGRDGPTCRARPAGSTRVTRRLIWPRRWCPRPSAATCRRAIRHCATGSRSATTAISGNRRRCWRRSGPQRRKATAGGDGFVESFPVPALTALLQAKLDRPQLSKADWIALGAIVRPQPSAWNKVQSSMQHLVHEPAPQGDGAPTNEMLEAILTPEVPDAGLERLAAIEPTSGVYLVEEFSVAVLRAAVRAGLVKIVR